MKIPAKIRKHIASRKIYIQVFAVLIQLIYRVFKMIKLKNFYLDLDYGDGDHARTGILKGAVEGFKGYLKTRTKKVDINFSPVFNEKKLDVKAELEINITGMRVLKQLFMILFVTLKKKHIRNFVYEFIKNKFFKKNKDKNTDVI